MHGPGRPATCRRLAELPEVGPDSSEGRRLELARLGCHQRPQAGPSREQVSIATQRIDSDG